MVSGCRSCGRKTDFRFHRADDVRQVPQMRSHKRARKFIIALNVRPPALNAIRDIYDECMRMQSTDRLRTKSHFRRSIIRDGIRG